MTARGGRDSEGFQLPCATPKTLWPCRGFCAGLVRAVTTGRSLNRTGGTISR